MECPNNCGELVELKKPAWVLFDFDIMEYLPEDVKQTVTICTLIHQICPKCGFQINTKLNLKKWQRFIKNHK